MMLKMLWTRGFCVPALLALALLLALCRSTPAGAQAPSSTEARVSLSLRDTPLRSALELLFQQAGVQFLIEDGVPNRPLTLNLQGAPFLTALRVITRLAGVTSYKESDIWIIGTRRQPMAPATTGPTLPEPPAVSSEPGVEKIPIQFNHAFVFGYALGGQALPSELDVQGGALGGLTGLGGLGASGGLNRDPGAYSGLGGLTGFPGGVVSGPGFPRRGRF
jgi:hypothetical protein